MRVQPAGHQWERLLEHLDLAEGFNLLFLICPSIQHAAFAREACADWLQKEGRRLESILPLDADQIKNIANVLISADNIDGDVLWVSFYPRADILIGADGPTQYSGWMLAMSRGLAGLNQARNLVARRQRRPIILAGTEELLQTSPAAAPDLWSIRRAVINLPAEASAGDLDRQSTVPFGTNLQSSSVLRTDVRDPVRPPSASLADAERALTAAQKVRGRAGAEYDLLRYLIRAAQALEGRGHLDELNQVLDEAADVLRRKNLPVPVPELGSLLNDLARIFQHSARYSQAEMLYRQAITIAETSHGKDQPVVATYLSNLAQLLSETNRVNEAEPLMRRALAIEEEAYGSEDSRVAADLNTLGLILSDTSRFEEAESVYRRALSIAEKAHGLDHPDVAISLNNLAQALHDTGRFSEAEPLMRRSLAIDERIRGQEHPSIGIRLNNLANLFLATNRVSEAEPLLQRVVAIFEKAYGRQHPYVATALNNLAQMLQATNRPDEAEPLMRRALAIDEKNYGAQHPDVARDLNNLGRLLQKSGRLTDAEALMRRMIEIFLSFRFQTGHEHPNFQAALENYRLLLGEMGWDDEKITRHIESVTESTKTGENHTK